jgi:hypothetical protein
MAKAKMQPQIEAPSRQSAETETRTNVGLDSNQVRLHPALTTLISFALLLLSGYFAFGVGIATIPQTIFFGAACSIGLAGLSTLIGGTATITIAKWFKATGYIAVFMAIVLLVMKALGVLSVPFTTRSSLFSPPSLALAWAISPPAWPKLAFRDFAEPALSNVLGDALNSLATAQSANMYGKNPYYFGGGSPYANIPPAPIGGGGSAVQAT